MNFIDLAVNKSYTVTIKCCVGCVAEEVVLVHEITGGQGQEIEDVAVGAEVGADTDVTDLIQGQGQEVHLTIIKREELPAPNPGRECIHNPDQGHKVYPGHNHNQDQ